MLTRHDLVEQRESIQDDLRCILDGLDENIVDNACQVVVDRMNILIDKTLKRGLKKEPIK